METQPRENPFSRIDRTSTDIQTSIINYLTVVASHPEIQRMRSAAFEMFAPAEGEKLLDAGCGVGEVALQLAARVGGTGSVSAVDHSEQAIAVARSRDDADVATYSVGDVTALDFPDAHFDGVRCERVLQHVPDSEAAIKELARVTRPGGRVCVVDSDWASSVEDGFQHLDEIRNYFFPEEHNRVAGRTLRARMVRAGLQNITVLPVTLRFTSATDAAVVAPYFNPFALQHVVPEEPARRFVESFQQAVDRGEFLFAFTMWICQGRVPLS